MKLQPVHIRIIGAWYDAAVKGIELDVALPDNEEERDEMISRMRTIAACNPHIFKNHAR